VALAIKSHHSGGVMKKLGRWILTILLILVIIAGAAGYYFKIELPTKVAQESFPQTAGEIDLAGLDASVDVYRDAMGIPHIYATTTHDLFFAQGYVHAQDRFWQMDFWRHTGSGRLSEMFGSSQADTDAFLRTLGWKQVAEQEWEQLTPEIRAYLQAYADGVNAYLEGHDGATASLEYSVLTLVINPEYKIEPWTPINSLTWTKAMAWDLGGNMDNEIERAVLLKTFSPEQVAELFPPYPADYPVIVPTTGENVSNTNNQQSAITGDIFDQSLVNYDPILNNLKSLEGVFGHHDLDIGSNSWLISGDRSETGKPFLANDMHLSIQMPSIWYQNSLHCLPVSAECPFNVTGFTFPGIPAVIAGHNDRIAWGHTNLGPDVQDLFIEKVNPKNPNQYEVDGEWVDFELREETINIAGDDPVTITVRISRHGPIISDTYNPTKDDIDPKKKPEATPFKDKVGIELPDTYAVALSWTALTPNSPIPAAFGFNKAHNWDEFRKAAKSWSVPAQNLVYADVDGNIGYQTPGVIPIRKNGDGTYPVPGWTGEYDWIGYIPFEDLPYSVNPKSGYIVAANNQANPLEYNYMITQDWDYGQRAVRISEMIENAPGKIGIAYIQSMHGDSKNLNAEALMPFLLSVKLEPELDAIREQYLKDWDYRDEADSQSAAIFEWFWMNLAMDTFNDQLPKAYWPSGDGRWYEVMRGIVQQPDSIWWDDINTMDATENRDDIFIKAFSDTVSQIQKKYGKDMSKLPRWGELHTATFKNLSLGKTGIFLIDDLFNRGPFETSGGKSIVNNTGWVVNESSFEITALPSEREILDLSNFDNSVATHTTGQSGHAYHPHYIDMAPLWANIEYAPMWWERESIENDSNEHLKLIPKQ